VEEVSRTLCEAKYMVLGLGDVYLGAPCAVPLDPRHRLVTTKYNPARTWTAEGEVGIGGVYMCIYGMESPGGYQLVGRTVPVWNTYKRTAEFQTNEPWLLRFFDQVQFFPMNEEDVLEFREEFLRGKVGLDVTRETFSVRAYHEFLRRDAESIAMFKGRQQKAFDEERERWNAVGEPSAPVPEREDGASGLVEIELPPGGRLVISPITGNIWAVLTKEGDRVSLGQKLIIVEAMKMELGVESPVAGVMGRILAAPGRLVSVGQSLAIVIEEATP
jgi:urea carboxylase